MKKIDLFSNSQENRDIKPPNRLFQILGTLLLKYFNKSIFLKYVGFQLMTDDAKLAQLIWSIGATQ